MSTFSAYLSVYNDCDILPHTLASIKDLVSEIVVVDGGYVWMQSYLEGTGKDPAKSLPNLYKILDDSGIPYRTISRIWENEIEKRIAGYKACNTDYIYRVDADEVTFLSADVLSDFIKDEGAVAQMDLPLYDSPGYVHWHKDNFNFPKQGFLFDRRQVSAEDHLHYLWLVLTADRLADRPSDLKPVYPKSVAFNAHLSHWRSPEGGLQRAVFYTLNYLRQNGAPTRSNLAPGPISDFSKLFEVIPPAIFESAMKRSEVINSQYKINPSLVPSPLTEEQEGIFISLYDKFLQNVKILDENALTEKQGYIYGSNLCFHRLVEKIGQTWNRVLEFDSDIEAADVNVNTVFIDEPFTAQTKPKVNIIGRRLEITVSEASFASPTIRQIMTVSVIPPSPRWFGSFKVLS